MTDYSKLSDREVNEAVAKALGCKGVHLVSGSLWAMSDKGWPYQIPDFSKAIDFAWPLVEKMNAMKGFAGVSHVFDPKTKLYQFWLSHNLRGICERLGTNVNPCRAICECFLRVMEQKTKEVK